MRDHLALTVCFSKDWWTLERERENVHSGPTYMHARSRLGGPVYSLYRQPYCHNFRDLGVKLHAQKRYESSLDSSIKVFDPSFPFERCPFCPGFHSAFDQADTEQFVTLSGARVIYNGVIRAVFRTTGNYAIDLSRYTYYVFRQVSKILPFYFRRVAVESITV